MVSSRRLQDYNWSQISNLASYRQPREISRIISLCNRIPEMTLLFDVIGGQGLRVVRTIHQTEEELEG